MLYCRMARGQGRGGKGAIVPRARAVARNKDGLVWMNIESSNLVLFAATISPFCCIRLSAAGFAARLVPIIARTSRRSKCGTRDLSNSPNQSK